MPTPLFLTGFEHQVTGTNSANGTGLYSSAPTGTAGTIDTSTFKSGAASFKVTLTAAVSSQSSNIFPVVATTTILADGFWFRFDGNPSVSTRIREFSLGGSVFLQVSQTTGGALQLVWSGGTTQVSGGTVALSTNTWYWVATNFKGDTTSFVGRLRVITEGGVITQPTDATVTGAAPSTLATAGRMGAINAVTVGTTRLNFFDDVMFGSATGLDDYWLPHKVIKLVPGSDGTHVNPGNFSNADTAGAIISGGNAATQYVDDATFTTAARSTTDNIRQTADITRASYLELITAATTESAVATSIRALLEYSAPAVTANSGATIVRHSGGFAVAVFGDFPTAQGGGNAAIADYSESSNFFKGALVPAPTVGWIPSEINQIRWRIGGADDVTPNPIWQALMLEVAYPIGLGFPFPNRVARNHLLRR